MRTRVSWLGLLATMGWYSLAAPAGAQPVGTEFQVNTYTTQAQRTRFPFGGHLVASDAAGNFVVVWSSNFQDGISYGVFGQRYDAAGRPRGAEFRVNSNTVLSQTRPSVAADADGNFVVVWEGPVGSSSRSFGPRFDGSGNPLGGDFQINTTTYSTQRQVSVASDSAGNFAVVWNSYGNPGGSTGDVIARRYDSDGQPRGG